MNSWKYGNRKKQWNHQNINILVKILKSCQSFGITKESSSRNEELKKEINVELKLWRHQIK